MAGLHEWQITGLGNELQKLNSRQLSAVAALRGAVEREELSKTEVSKTYLQDSVYVNFLIARDWDHDKVRPSAHARRRPPPRPFLPLYTTSTLHIPPPRFPLELQDAS